MKKKLIYLYDHFEEGLLVVLFAVLVAVITLQVIMRFVFNNSLSWTEETGKYLFVWLSWLGISIGAKAGEHIKITALTQKLPFSAAQICNILSELVVISICGVTIYYGIVMCDMLIGLKAMNSALRINQAWGYAAVPVGCGLMVCRSIRSILASLRMLKSGKPPQNSGADNLAEGGTA